VTRTDPTAPPAPLVLRRFGPDEARVDLLADRTIVVLGYGAQGRANALNLRDAGCRVHVAQRPQSPRHAQAVDDGFRPIALEHATTAGELLIFAVPDEEARGVYERYVRPRLASGQTLGFLHGFALHYRQIVAPAGVDAVLVAPKAQGAGVRREFLAGRGVVCLIAVAQDASGRALQTALGWAAGIGGARAGILLTTVRDETETDLFGEQAVLCGGLTALIKAGFETLVEAGYPPELAYLECVHELKLLADLIHEGGLTYMRERISNAARYGDLTRGPRVIAAPSREAMRQLLAEIRSGQFAEALRRERDAGYVHFRALTDADRTHLLERVGWSLRTMMHGREPSADAQPGDST
jgi:ketol-acid reductoisomerase